MYGKTQTMHFLANDRNSIVPLFEESGYKISLEMKTSSFLPKYDYPYFGSLYGHLHFSYNDQEVSLEDMNFLNYGFNSDYTSIRRGQGNWSPEAPKPDTVTYIEVLYTEFNSQPLDTSKHPSLTREGTWLTYLAHGPIYSSTEYKNDLKNGKQQLFDKKGRVKSDTTFVNGVKNGISTTFWKNGSRMESKYANGRRAGDPVYYNKKGEIRPAYHSLEIRL